MFGHKAIVEVKRTSNRFVFAEPAIHGRVFVRRRVVTE